MSEIGEVVDAHISTDADTRARLIGALTEREDNMADILRLAGMQFGMFPFIVAEVLAQVGLGTAPTEEARDMIRQSYISGMEELRRAQEGDNN